MQPKTKIFFLLLLAAVINSCKKNAGPVANISINIVNASNGIANALVKTPNATGFFTHASNISYGNNNVFTVPMGGTVSVFADTDTLHSLYSNRFVAGSIYSLFVAGADGEDIIVHQDNIPYHADSTMGARFMNLSVGSSPVSVNIQGQANGSEVASLSYKTLTDFKTYPAGAALLDPGYSFEFRNAADGTLLATLNTGDYWYLYPGYYSVPLYYNITIILYGATGNQQAMIEPNF